MLGMGRELGEEGLDEFRETKHVHRDFEGGKKPWWYPYWEVAGPLPRNDYLTSSIGEVTFTWC
jgi:hypothetical protein